MDVPVDSPPEIADLPETVVRELQRRVAHLEDSVARLEDTKALEERLVARLHDRLPQSKVVAEFNTEIVEERVLARLSERLPAAADGRAHPATVQDLEITAVSIWGGGWSSWLIVDMLREARLLAHMIIDRRYRMAWTTRLVALIFLPLILTTHWWLPLAWLPGVGGFFVNIVNLLLAFALYKALSREGRRYRDTGLHH